MESFLGVVLSALRPSVDWGAPDAVNAIVEHRRLHEKRRRADKRGGGGMSDAGDHGALDRWDSDPVIVAFQNPVLLCDMSAGGKGPSKKPPGPGLAPIVSSNAFLDDLLGDKGRQASAREPASTKNATARGSHAGAAHVSAGMGGSGGGGAMTLPLLPPKRKAECRTHVRELCALRSILQRPSSAFQLIGAYDVFIARVTSEQAHFVAYLIESIEKVWYNGVRCTSGSHLAFLLQLLCLYSEVLFYLSLHTATPEDDSSSASSWDDDDDEGDDARDSPLNGNERAEGGSGSERKEKSPAAATLRPDFMRDALNADSVLKTKLLRLIVDLSGAVHPGRTPNYLHPRRCAVLLASVCLHNIAEFDDDILAEAQRTKREGDNVLDFCLMATLPRHAALFSPPRGEGEGGLGDDLTRPLPVGDLADPRAQAVIELVCSTTIYSLDLTTLFREEGRAGPLLRDAASLCVGAAIQDAWAVLSSNVWRYFTKDALLGAAKAMCLYAWSWHQPPACMVGLLDFIDEGLQDAVSAFESEKQRKNQARLLLASGGGGDAAAAAGASLEDSLRLGHTRGPNTARLDALLAGALDHDDGGGYDNTEEEEVVDVDCSVVGEGRLTSSGRWRTATKPDAFCFADPQEQVMYFLSLHALSTASLTCVCEGFASMAGDFLWAPPTPPPLSAWSPREKEEEGHHSNGQPSRSTEGSAPSFPAEDAHPSATTEKQRSWASLFPMPIAFVEDGGVVKVNLLHQVLAYLAALCRSPEFPSLLAPSPATFSRAAQPTNDASKEGEAAETAEAVSDVAPLLAVTFQEAALSLLYHTHTAFPHELSELSRSAGVDVLGLFVSAALTFLRSPEHSHGSNGPPRLLYELFQRFGSAVENPEVPASLLLPRDLLRRVGSQQPATTTIAFDQLVLFVRLCRNDTTERVLPCRLLWSLVYLEPGVLGNTVEGVEYFAFYLHQVFELLTLGVPNLGYAHGNHVKEEGCGAGGDACADDWTVDKAVGNLFTLLPTVSRELVVSLITRLCNGVAGLLRTLDQGVVVVGGSPVGYLLNFSLQVLAEVVRLSGYTTLVTSLLLSASPDFNDDHPAPVSYFLLAAVFQMQGLPLRAMVAAAQLLCAAVPAKETSLYPALRSHMAKPLRFSLAAALHQRMKADVGTRENAVRLQTLRVLAVKDMQTIQYLVGPDSLPGNHEAKELTDLIIAKDLSQIILAGDASLCAEKAAALHALVSLGLTDAVSISRVLTTLTDASQALSKHGQQQQQQQHQGQKQRQEEMQQQPHDLVALAAAAAVFVNAALLEQAKGKREDAARAGNRTQPPTPRTSVGGRSRGGSVVTPLLLGSPGVVSGGSSPMSSEAMDAVLRRGSDCLLAAATVYEDLSLGEFFFFPDTSVQLSPEAALTVQEDASVLGPGSAPVWARGTISGDGGALGSRSLLPLPGPAVGTQRSFAMRGEATLSRLAAATAASRANRSAYHTEALPDVVANVSVRQDHLFPLMMGESYLFRPLFASDADELVTSTYNVLASVLAAMGELAAAMEASLWLHGGDGERGALFLNRSSAVLHAAIRCTLIAKPGAPAVAPSLWAAVQRSLSLAGAAAFAIASPGGQLLREVSIGGGSVAPPPGVAGAGGAAASSADVGVGDESHRGLRHLVTFMGANTGKLPIVNLCLAVFAALPSTTADLAVWEELFRMVLCTTQGLKGFPETPEALAEELLFFKNVTALFEVSEVNSCPTAVLAFLAPAVFRRAKALSHGIAANDAEGPLSLYFCQCLQCLRSAFLHASDVTAAAAFLPAAEVAGLVEALGHFSYSVAPTEVAVHASQRQSWHAAWCAALELLVAVLAGSGAGGAHSARESTWLQAAGAVLPQLPRFLLALGAFTSVPESSRVYYVWDVQEMGLCTELAAVMSALDYPLPSLLPHIQRAFLHIHQFRLARNCIATTNQLPETIAGEKRLIESTLVLMARHQLSFLMVQGSHGVPLSMLTPQDGPVVLTLHNDVQNGREGAGSGALTFDVVRRFVVQELHAIRHASADTPAGGSTGSRSSAPPTPSRETSMPPTPSRPRDYDTVTEEDNGTTLADALMEREVADHRALHIDLAQLALGLFATSAEEIVRQEQQLKGLVPSHTALHELRSNTGKLLHVLDSLKRDLKKMDSPKLTVMVMSIRERLKAVTVVP